MSQAELSSEQPHLSPQARAEILEQLWRLEERPLHPGVKSAAGTISSDIDGCEAHRAHLA